MEEIQEGFVIKNEGEFARVQVQAHGSCENCGACDTAKMEILAYNSLQAKPGQQVRFVMQQGNMMRVALVLFVLPMLAIFAGAALGYFASILFHFHQNLSMIVLASV
jgi:sigma-E factor negative regulatory protein RseC